MIVLILALLDGGSVHLEVKKTDKIELVTKYGTLSVPLSDVSSVNLGCHVENEAAYREAAQALGDEVFAKRDIAMKFLGADKRLSYRFLMAVKDDPNLERAKRANQLLAHGETFPLTDRISLFSGEVIEGEIRNKSLTGVSKSLGKLTVGVHVVSSMRFERQRTTLTLQADKEWHKVGHIDGRVRITAEGTVDMWPQTPGQYMSTPKGLPNMNGPYPAGALIGRIDGHEFFVGDGFTATDMRPGELWLKIHPAPWDSVPSGEYKVIVE